MQQILIAFCFLCAIVERVASVDCVSERGEDLRALLRLRNFTVMKSHMCYIRLHYDIAAGMVVMMEMYGLDDKIHEAPDILYIDRHGEYGVMKMTLCCGYSFCNLPNNLLGKIHDTEKDSEDFKYIHLFLTGIGKRLRVKEDEEIPRSSFYGTWVFITILCVACYAHIFGGVLAYCFRKRYRRGSSHTE
uniref:CX domain-containing protein n=1 Tax=Haemonchus contortus TaxID=6289 RepID=A0A7I5E797_HAECO|nr:unnamed protein product [Haemonchus contortus]